MTRVLIAGGGGQVGRALQATAPDGYAVIAPPRAAFDIADERRVSAMVREIAPDIVINAAAYTAVDRAEADEDAACRVNAEGARWLAAGRGDAAFVHLSTDFVFDGTAHRPYPPSAEPAPLSAYGRTKLAGEQAVRAADPSSLVIRTAWVYAAHGQNFVQTMLRLMRARDEVRVVADQIGTPTHATGLARAIWRLAGHTTGLHHWTDAGVASWYDFAVAIQEVSLALGLLDRAAAIIPIRTEDYPTPAVRPAYSVLDKTATWALTGPARHWRVELRDCLAEIAAS